MSRDAVVAAVQRALGERFRLDPDPPGLPKTSLRPEAPPALSEVLARGLARATEERFADAGPLRASLIWL